MTRIFNIMRAQKNLMSQSVEFFVAQEKRYTKLADHRILTEDGVVDYTPRIGEDIGPSFRVQEEAVQVLFEELWALGFRSKHDNGNSDKLDAARTEHIQDLRKVAKIG